MNFLHPSHRGFVWFRSMLVTTVVPGAISLAAVRWNTTRDGLARAFVGPGPGGAGTREPATETQGYGQDRPAG